jgi:hypothetical protein
MNFLRTPLLALRASRARPTSSGIFSNALAGDPGFKSAPNFGIFSNARAGAAGFKSARNFKREFFQTPLLALRASRARPTSSGIVSNALAGDPGFKSARNFKRGFFPTLALRASRARGQLQNWRGGLQGRAQLQKASLGSPGVISGFSGKCGPRGAFVPGGRFPLR